MRLEDEISEERSPVGIGVESGSLPVGEGVMSAADDIAEAPVEAGKDNVEPFTVGTWLRLVLLESSTVVVSAGTGTPIMEAYWLATSLGRSFKSASSQRTVI